LSHDGIAIEVVVAGLVKVGTEFAYHKIVKPSILKILLISTVLGLQIGTVILFAGDAKQRVEQDVDENTRRNLSTLAETVAARTETFLQDAEATIEAGAEIIGLGMLEPSDDQALARWFSSRLKSDRQLHSIFFARDDGSFVTVVRRDEHLLKRIVVQTPSGGEEQYDYPADMEGRLRQSIKRATSFDPRARPWYASASDSHALAWSDPFAYFSSGVPGLTASMTVNGPDGKRIGILGLSIDIGAFSRFIDQIPGAGEGNAAVLDDAERVIAATTEGWVDFARQQARLPAVDELKGDSLPLLFRAMADDAASGIGAGVSGQLALENGVYFALMRPLGEGHLSRGLSLFVHMPVVKYKLDLSNYFATHWPVLLAVVVLMALVATCAVHGLMQPIVRLHRDATIDRLTGALSRVEFDRRLQRLAQERRADEIQTRLVIAMFDMDGFKTINDTHGHAAGDAVLKEFTRRLKARLRKGDIVGRPGGDEFVVAMRLRDGVDAHRTFESIRQATVGEPIVRERASYPVGVTIGVAVYRAGESLKQVIGRADRALIDGKQFEKNRVYLEGPSAPPLTLLEAIP